MTDSRRSSYRQRSVSQASAGGATLSMVWA